VLLDYQTRLITFAITRRTPYVLAILRRLINTDVYAYTGRLHFLFSRSERESLYVTDNEPSADRRVIESCEETTKFYCVLDMDGSEAENGLRRRMKKKEQENRLNSDQGTVSGYLISGKITRSRFEKQRDGDRERKGESIPTRFSFCIARIKVA